MIDDGWMMNGMLDGVWMYNGWINDGRRGRQMYFGWTVELISLHSESRSCNINQPADFENMDFFFPLIGCFFDLLAAAAAVRSIARLSSPVQRENLEDMAIQR